MALNIKQSDYLINDNGDVWQVGTVRRNGDIVLLDVSGAGDDIVYSSSQIESWFRKVAEEDTNFGLRPWLDPKKFWEEAKPVVFHSRKATKSRSKSRSRGSNLTSLRGIR